MLPVMGGSKHTQGLVATVTTALTIAALVKSLLPAEWVRESYKMLSKLGRVAEPFCFFTFHEFSGQTPDHNYDKIEVYLSDEATAQVHRVVVSQPRKSAQPIFALADGEWLMETYHGVTMEWTHNAGERGSAMRDPRARFGRSQEAHSFCLRLHQKHKHIVTQYLQHIHTVANERLEQRSELQVYNNMGMCGSGERAWDSQPFKHPANFDTIALNCDIKQTVISTLDRFVTDAHYYNKTGRAHKMGIFLFGPPGTGKTTFIAAVANYLHYNIYDLDLTNVGGNQGLRQLFSQIPDRTVVVIEDIDSLGLPNRATGALQHPDLEFDSYSPVMHPVHRSRYEVTLGGLLNFADGIRSSCASQHIFIFTTNHPELLDPALIRPGRMDLHIELPYCTFQEFQSLCKTYMGVSEHSLFDEVKELLQPVAKVAPADVTAVLHAHRGNADRALQQLVALLKSRGADAEAAAEVSMNVEE